MNLKRFISLSLYVTAAWLALLSGVCIFGGILLGYGCMGGDISAIPLGLSAGFACMFLAPLVADLAEWVECH